jgi:hypothetical protein
MKKKTTLFLFFLFLINLSQAQFSNTKHAEALKIKNSILLVSLEEEDGKFVTKLKKKKKRQAELKSYLDNIAGRNEAIKNAFENYWTFSDKVEFHPRSVVEKLMKENKGKYVDAMMSEFKEYEKFKTHIGLDGRKAGWRSTPSGLMEYNPSTKYSVTANIITTLKIGNPKEMITMYLPNALPSKADLVYGVQQMQFILNYLVESEDHKMSKIKKHIQTLAPKLKDKILLIDRKLTHKKMTNKTIKSIYPFEFELVEGKVLDEAIENKDERYAYVQIVDTPGGKGNVSVHFVMGADDGEIYCIVAPKVAVTLKGTSIIRYNEKIKKKQIQKYAEYAL